jgi:hypothetical protein
MNRSIGWSLLCLLLGSLAGCSSGSGSVNLSGWRDTVERYIDKEGQGDPNVLRNVTWPQSRREFSVIGGEVPTLSQDARGVLIGVPQVGNARWFAFLVGIVNKGVVRDIRLVALNNTGGQRTWRTSPVDANALHMYQAYYDQLWRSRFPGRESPPMQYTSFPKDSDTFDLAINGGTLIAKHAASGATWSVVVDPRAVAGG